MRERQDFNRSNGLGRSSKPKKPSLLAQSRYNPRYDEPYDPRTRHNSRRTKRRPKIDLKRHPTLKTYDQIAKEEAELKSESNQVENLVAFNYLNAGETSLYGERENLTREEKLQLTEDAQRIKEVGIELLEGALLGDFNDDPTFWAAVGQIVTGFIPIAGQLADFRDLIHALDDICNQEGYKKIGSWANLLLVLVAFVPGLGDIAAKLGKKGIKALGNSRILKKIMDLFGDNIIAPIAREGGDITTNVVKSIKLTILDLLESAKNLAKQLGAEVDGAIDNLIGQEKLRLQTPDGVRIDTNQPMQIRGTTSSSTTTVRGVVSSLLGKDFKNLTPAELTQFNKNYYTQTRSGLPPIIKRKKGKANQGIPQIHIEEVGGKQIIKPGAASASARLSNANAMKNNYIAKFGKIATGHQIHHIIPDAIVRRNELAKTAYDKGIFDLDRATNLQAFASTGAAGEIVHRGPHDKWSNYVDAVLKDEQKKLLRKYKVAELKDIPEATLEKELKAIFGRVEKNLRKDLNNIPEGLKRGWLKLDNNGSGSYKISENEEQDTQIVVA